MRVTAPNPLPVRPTNAELDRWAAMGPGWEATPAQIEEARRVAIAILYDSVL